MYVAQEIIHTLHNTSHLSKDFLAQCNAGHRVPNVYFCPQSCVAAFLDVVIGGRAVETPPMSSMNLLEGLNRTAVYMTHNQLFVLVRSFAVVIQMHQCEHLLV